jgi:hypothetical protein
MRGTTWPRLGVMVIRQDEWVDGAAQFKFSGEKVLQFRLILATRMSGDIEASKG